MPDVVDLRLPAKLRLGELEAGPLDGWAWDGDAEIVRIAPSGPLEHIEPVGLAMMSAWGAHQRERLHRTVEVDSTHHGPYAWQVGLGPAVRGEPARPREGRSGPVRVAAAHTARALQASVDALGLPHESTADVLLHCLDDLCTNVFQHAPPHTGAHVAAQFDPRSGLLRLGVADCGKGIAADVKGAYRNGAEMTDVQAVEMALQAEVSGSSDPDRNRGVGLTVVRKLALAGEGAFWIRTGDVVVRSHAGTPSGADPEVQRMLRGSWRGTCVAATLKASAITDFQLQMRAILDEIEGRGPRYDAVRFVNKRPADSHPAVSVEPDAAGFAIDRDRASALRTEHLVPLLQRHATIVVDFARTHHASQGWCHTLLFPVVRDRGPQVLDALVFAACSGQVRLMIRSAIQSGLREHDGATPR